MSPVRPRKFGMQQMPINPPVSQMARITSSGIFRNASSNDPISTTGHSTSPATSSSSPISSTTSSLWAKARFFASASTIRIRCSGSSTTFAASSAGT